MNPFEILPGRDGRADAPMMNRPAPELSPAAPPRLLLVDVRTADEARREPIELAQVRVPIVEFPSWDTGDDRSRDFNLPCENPAFVAAVSQALAAQGMARSEPVLLFCPTARRARRAACRLRQAGFLRPYALRLEAVRMIWGHPDGIAATRALINAG